MTNTMAVRTTGKRFVCVVIFSTLFALFTAMRAQGAIIPRLKEGAHLSIAAIGTSLTATSFNAQNWFAQTGAWLSAKYPGQVTLSNRAVSGEISALLPPRWTHGGPWQLDQVLANDNPDVIFIEFAINDAHKTVNFSPAVSASNLKTLIDRINTWAEEHSKNVDIVVQTMNNTGPSYAPQENDVGPYYQAWREQAAASKVLLIDHYPNWINLYNSQPDHATWKSYIPDDIHPNTLGTTTVILPEVQRVLNAQVPEPSSSVLLGTCLLGLLGYVWRKCNCLKMVLGIGVFSAVAIACATGSAASLGNIMPLGDSITYGYSCGSPSPGGYRAQLYSRLTAAGYSFSFVGSCTDNSSTALASAGQTHHEGHSAIRLDQIEANLDGNTEFPSGNGGYWLSGTASREALDPDIVLLMAGINDIAQPASATTTRDRLDSLIGHIFQDRPNATVIVANLTPMTGACTTAYGERADAYNAMIPSVVDKYHAEKGKKAYFLDMHNKLTSADISPDDVHPTQSGYDKMGDAWFGAIQEVPEPSSVILSTTGLLGLVTYSWHRRRSLRV